MSLGAPQPMHHGTMKLVVVVEVWSHKPDYYPEPLALGLATSGNPKFLVRCTDINHFWRVPCQRIFAQKCQRSQILRAWNKAVQCCIQLSEPFEASQYAELVSTAWAWTRMPNPEKPDLEDDARDHKRPHEEHCSLMRKAAWSVCSILFDGSCFSPLPLGNGQRQCQLWSRFGDLAFKSIPFLTSQELLRPVLKAGAAVEDRWQQRGLHTSPCFITNVGSPILNHPQLSALLGAKGIHNTELLINPNRWWCITSPIVMCYLDLGGFWIG